MVLHFYQHSVLEPETAHGLAPGAWWALVERRCTSLSGLGWFKVAIRVLNGDFFSSGYLLQTVPVNPKPFLNDLTGKPVIMKL